MCDEPKLLRALMLEACHAHKDTYPEDNSNFLRRELLDELWDDFKIYPNYQEDLRNYCKMIYSKWYEIEEYYIEILQFLKALPFTLVIALFQEHAIDCFLSDERDEKRAKSVQKHVLPRLKRAGFAARRIE